MMMLAGVAPAPGRVTTAARADDRPIGAARLARIGTGAGLAVGVAFALHLGAIAEIAAAPTPAPGIRSSTWTPFTAIASFFLGDDVFHGGFWPVWIAIGLAIHLLVSAVVGIGGAWWTYVCLGTRGAPLLAGALGASYGVFVQIVALQTVVNAIQSPNLVYNSLPPWAWWAGHALFGAALGMLASWRLGARR